MGGESGMYSGGAYRILMGKLGGKRSPGITRRRWQDNIKTYLKNQ
jgi:hypothetical protein